MFESGLTSITMLFVILGACIMFVIVWIVKSEAKINGCKREIKRLKEKSESLERDKFMLSEELNAAPAPAPAAQPDNPKRPAQSKKDEAREKANQALVMQLMDQNKTLEAENKKLQKEVEDAKNSLEEVYKAISSKK